MALPGNLLPTQPKEPTIWQTGEALNDLFAEANSLEEVCRLGLEFILSTLGRQSGALFVQRAGEQKPYYLWSQNAPPGWQPNTQPPAAPRPFTSFPSQSPKPTTESKPVENENGKYESYAGTESAVCPIPLDHVSGTEGLLLLFGKECTPEEVSLLSILGRSTARAIHAWRKRPFSRAHARQLEALHTLELGSDGDPEALHEQLLRRLCHVLDAESAAIVLPTPFIENPVVQKIWWKGNLHSQLHPEKPGGLVQASFARQTVIRSRQPDAEPGFDPAWDAPVGLALRSSMTAPFPVNSGDFGVLQVFNKHAGPFRSEDEELFGSMARLAAQFLHAMWLIRSLQVANADLEASHWELLHSRNTLNVLFDSIPAAIYIIDAGYRLVALNRSRLQQSGQTAQDLLGQVCYAGLYQRDTPCPGCRVAETFSAGLSTNRISRGRDHSDEPLEWEISTYPITEEDQQVSQVVILEQDVTEKRRLENILAQSEKLAAVGQLAAGIAHEINNPLTAILANAQLLQRDLPKDSDLRESVDLIARAGARATQVVRNLLDFARRDYFEPELIDVNENIRHALALVQHELRARQIRLDFQPGANLPLLFASPDHLLGVWLNLLLNAIDAIEREGQIRVTSALEQERLRVTIADSGKGISPEKLLRIFEPFYTTKAPGRGTGLGLTVCQRIIKQHGGIIEVNSEPGKGSWFTVTLPV